MLRGWFDAFRVNGGPTLYSAPNRTPVIEDIRNILVYVTFSTLFIAFLLIFPGIRKERFSTLITVTTSLFVGATILLSNFGTDWHVSSAPISAPYRAFSRERLSADISVRIGLNSVNVTLQAGPSSDINYNERFGWIEATQLKSEFRQALVKGLPFPILTIAEYLSQNMEGFSWGGKYRKAGYYTSILLWATFAGWLLTNLLLCVVPRYGAYSMLGTGLMLLACSALYCAMLPKVPLLIHFEERVLAFNFGWCFWAIIAAGVLSACVGALLSVLDHYYPNKFSTIFEVDYDTPYRYFVGQDCTPRDPVPPPPSAVASSPGDLFFASPSGSADGLVNDAFEEDDVGVAATIVDGKRAVSLRNFGKFAAQREAAGRRKQMSYVQRKINSFSGLHGPPRAKQVNINMTSAAGMW